MSRNTAETIRRVALNLFSTRRFETVPVAGICREAGISNGLFYRYFPDKETLVRDILEKFLERFSGELAEVRDLSSFVEVVAEAALRHGPEVAVFREGQYRLAGYEHRLRERYIEALTRVFGRDVSGNEYLYCVGGLRFLSTRALYTGRTFDRELCRRFIAHGVFPGQQWSRPETLPERPEEIQPTDTRTRLLEAGIRAFGRDGYHGAGVSDVVREADLSVGAFYLHFRSKESFLTEIVGLIGSRIRRHLRDSVSPAGSRLKQELQGIHQFLAFFGANREYYRIIREAEFVDPATFTAYYDGFSRGYRKNLVTLPEHERAAAAEFLMGLTHYLGIEVLVSDRIPAVEPILDQIGQLMSSGVNHSVPHRV